MILKNRFFSNFSDTIKSTALEKLQKSCSFNIKDTVRATKSADSFQFVKSSLSGFALIAQTCSENLETLLCTLDRVQFALFTTRFCYFYICLCFYAQKTLFLRY